MLAFEFTEVEMVSSSKQGCKQQEYSMLLQLPCDFTLMHLSYTTSLSCIPGAQAGITFGFMHSTHHTGKPAAFNYQSTEEKMRGKEEKQSLHHF